MPSRTASPEGPGMVLRFVRVKVGQSSPLPDSQRMQTPIAPGRLIWRRAAQMPAAEALPFREAARSGAIAVSEAIDQIVLPAEKYLTARPGAAKNDATILPLTRRPR
jgi:hypothetical protein